MPPPRDRNHGSPKDGDATIVVDKPRSKVWQPPAPQELSKVLLQYEVDMLLGRGGMGAVYKGRHLTLDRAVAIKILPPEMDDIDDSYAQRFKNEARAMARLSHPNIVSVYDFGETSDGLLYFVMEFIEGMDVHKMLKEQGRLQCDHVKNIIAQVCDALDYAHEMKIIHRDIKPANIMVGYDGKVKVADFGLANITKGSDSFLTKSNALLGTLHYMAPEALTLGTLVDHRADIFAMGVMLYQMLTGKLPQGMFEMPSKRVEGVDVQFDVIIGKALMEDRDKRYQTVAQMRVDFAEILAPKTTQMQTQTRRSRMAANRLGRYKIVSGEDGKPVLLGTGSAGKTYKAVHSLLGTTVALKVIHEALAYDAEVRQRFLNEAKAIAKLKHPHIAQLVDCDEDDGALFCAIEYCDGGNLEKLVASTGALSDETALLFGRQAAKALAYVHDEGFLHRDLKPSNLMLSMVPGTNTANIKLIDFGLVKALGQTSGLTRKGHFRGTLLYTSPEQLREEELDERTDVFSLGMTLWFMLLGRLPMENDQAQITKRRLSKDSHAEELPASTHPAMRALLRQMLQPDKTRRARNMHAVLAGIDESLNMIRRQVAPLTRRRSSPGIFQQQASAPSTQVRQPSRTNEEPSSTPSTTQSSIQRAAAAEDSQVRMTIRDIKAPGKVENLPSQALNTSTRRGEPARQVLDMPLSAKFQLFEELEGVHPETGTAHRAVRLSNKDVVRLTLLHPEVANDRQTVKNLRELLDKAFQCPGEFLVRPLTMIRFTDHAVLLEEMAEGPRMLELLRARQRISLAEAGSLLLKVAGACDQASGAGIAALDMAPHHVVLQFPSIPPGKSHEEKVTRMLSMPLSKWPAYHIRLALDYDSSGGEGMAWRFARFAYHLLSGLPAPPPHAPRNSYVPVAGISEEANRLLSKVVSGELMVADCVPFMRSLLQMENVMA